MSPEPPFVAERVKILELLCLKKHSWNVDMGIVGTFKGVASPDYSALQVGCQFANAK